jgi:hypothetical protein
VTVRLVSQLVDTQMGTKRPLIIQMVNDPKRNEPFCRFKREELLLPHEDPFEARDVPVSYLCEEICMKLSL